MLFAFRRLNRPPPLNRFGTATRSCMKVAARGLPSLAELQKSKSISLQFNAPDSKSGVEMHTLAGTMTAGGTIVGTGDRGAGLRYKESAPPRESGLPSNPFLVKVQPPLDDSSDAQGGIGRTMPTTLMIHNR